jgi:hypothetical protein
VLKVLQSKPRNLPGRKGQIPYRERYFFKGTPPTFRGEGHCVRKEQEGNTAAGAFQLQTCSSLNESHMIRPMYPTTNDPFDPGTSTQLILLFMKDLTLSDLH